MGSLINFYTKFNIDNNKKIPFDHGYEIISLLPLLKKMNNMVIIIAIHKNHLLDENILNIIIKDIIIMKHLGLHPMIIIDNNIDTESFLKDSNIEIKKIKKPNVKDVSIANHFIEVLFLEAVAKKISALIFKLGGMGIVLSGSDCNLINVSNYSHKDHTSTDINKDTLYNTTLNSFFSYQNPNEINLDLINEIKKTNFIPIITPISISKNDELFIIDSNFLASIIAIELNAEKLIITNNLDEDILNNKITGVTKFEKIFHQFKTHATIMPIMENIVHAVKNGVQNAYILNCEKHSLINELCANATSGLMIYDDCNYDI